MASLGHKELTDLNLNQGGDHADNHFERISNWKHLSFDNISDWI